MPYKNHNAIEILKQRYIRDDAAAESLERETINAKVAHSITALRTRAGLTQKQLAEKVGTTQSVISRLEDADYDGHSLSMLNRIATALNQRVSIIIEPHENAPDPLRTAFRELIRQSRLAHRLTQEELAKKLGISLSETLSLEQNDTYIPPPLLLYRLSKLFDIPQRRLAILIGAIREIPESVRSEASRFAAKSESFSKLTPEERKELDRFVQFLRSEI